VLKVREEQLGHGRIEWRGEVLDVAHNTLSTFEDWPDLVDLIAEALDNLALSPALRGSTDTQSGRRGA